MSILERLRGRPVVEDDAAYRTADLDEDSLDAVRSRIFSVLKKPISWLAFLGVFLALSVGVMWRYGSVPTSVPPVAVYKEVEGKTFVMELVRQMREETNHGWVPNDLPYPRVLLLYRNAYQLGKHEVWQVAVDALRRQIAQDGRSVDPIENLDRAYFAISAAPDRIFMFPTAGMYVDEAADYLEAYAKELETDHHFYARAESLAALLANMQQYLDASVTQLSDSKSIEPMMGYYPFQLAQGRIHAILGMLRAINVDFQSVIVTKAGSQGPLDRTIIHLENGLAMSPWLIMNKWMGYNDLGTLLQSVSPAAPELAQLTNIIRGTNSR